MNHKLDNYIGKLKTLPTAPDVLVKLVAMFQKPDRDIDEVAILIRKDPSLTAGVLRHANSAYFSPEQPIGDVYEAILWIGFGQVYQAVVAKLATQSLHLPKNAAGIDTDQLWRHSMATGVCASAIAKRINESESMAFTAGVLHDIGKIILILAEGENYHKLVSMAGSGGPLLEDAETTCFGFGHAEIGASLLDRWGLPEDVCQPVRCHHRYVRDQSLTRIGAAVSLGNIMAHVAADSVPKRHFDSQEAVQALSTVKLTKDDLALLLEKSQDEIRHLAGSLA